MSLRVGIFGGTFNPIHIGHLALANYLREFEGLDEVWFMVSPQNPFKKGPAIARRPYTTGDGTRSGKRLSVLSRLRF